MEVILQKRISSLLSLATTFHVKPPVLRYYDKKYEVFLKLVEHQQEYKAIMQSVSSV
ncbi:hypothetical protein JRQ81_014839 [Phrynocephalus forsythii]|uniref:Uncharacterized protein n=1 Tax=Phrynocephalus forsythii TaxID=171643 RepID=A0A9Q0XXG5_9SAUR|nr:hypothetical protein JRQ81_014839 [Phrynocephalus forsythii]